MRVGNATKEVQHQKIRVEAVHHGPQERDSGNQGLNGFRNGSFQSLTGSSPYVWVHVNWLVTLGATMCTLKLSAEHASAICHAAHAEDSGLQKRPDSDGPGLHSRQKPPTDH